MFNSGGIVPPGHFMDANHGYCDTHKKVCVGFHDRAQVLRDGVIRCESWFVCTEEVTDS